MERKYQDFGVDSFDYDFLERACTMSWDVEGATFEIGVREGGASECIIDNTPINKVHIAIDPYGHLPYFGSDGPRNNEPSEYSNEMKRFFLARFYEKCRILNKEFIFFQFKDSDFFSLFSHGVPYYRDGKELLINKYSLVFFDGPHDTESILKESEFFILRSIYGTLFCYDNITEYNHNRIHNFMIKNGFVEVERKDRKVSYRCESVS